jgi:hypothetical protein
MPLLGGLCTFLRKRHRTHKNITYQLINFLKHIPLWPNGSERAISRHLPISESIPLRTGYFCMSKTKLNDFRCHFQKTTARNVKRQLHCCRQRAKTAVKPIMIYRSKSSQYADNISSIKQIRTICDHSSTWGIMKYQKTLQNFSHSSGLISS